MTQFETAHILDGIETIGRTKRHSVFPIFPVPQIWRQGRVLRMKRQILQGEVISTGYCL